MKKEILLLLLVMNVVFVFGQEEQEAPKSYGFGITKNSTQGFVFGIGQYF